MGDQGYYPEKSRVGADALATFLTSPIDENLESIPGIGQAISKAFAEPFEGDPPIETTFQLLGKFLTLKGPGMSSQEHCDAMWFYLKARLGATGNGARAGIVQCLAKKADMFMPGLYTLEA